LNTHCPNDEPSDILEHGDFVWDSRRIISICIHASKIGIISKSQLLVVFIEADDPKEVLEHKLANFRNLSFNKLKRN
jgi:hypothetical protein